MKWDSLFVGCCEIVQFSNNAVVLEHQQINNEKYEQKIIQKNNVMLTTLSDLTNFIFSVSSIGGTINVKNNNQDAK